MNSKLMKHYKYYVALWRIYVHYAKIWRKWLKLVGLMKRRRACPHMEIVVEGD